MPHSWLLLIIEQKGHRNAVTLRSAVLRYLRDCFLLGIALKLGRKLLNRNRGGDNNVNTALLSESADMLYKLDELSHIVSAYLERRVDKEVGDITVACNHAANKAVACARQ